MQQRPLKRLPDEYEATIAKIERELERSRHLAATAIRERDLAEARGRRWFRDAAIASGAMDRAMVALDIALHARSPDAMREACLAVLSHLARARKEMT